MMNVAQLKAILDSLPNEAEVFAGMMDEQSMQFQLVSEVQGVGRGLSSNVSENLQEVTLKDTVYLVFFKE